MELFASSQLRNRPLADSLSVLLVRFDLLLICVCRPPTDFLVDEATLVADGVDEDVEVTVVSPGASALVSGV